MKLKQDEAKRNETKWNELKGNETKQNETKQNEPGSGCCRSSGASLWKCWREGGRGDRGGIRGIKFNLGRLGSQWMG
jgi:hypothetical protein